MKTITKCVLLAACCASFLQQANAQPAVTVTLAFSPSLRTISLGESTTMDVLVAGLDGPVALGAYDLDFNYDPSVVSVVNITFPSPPNSGLNLGTYGSVTYSNSGVGAAHMDEVSLEDGNNLSLNQPASFILATVQFQGIALGYTLLDFSYVSLSDQDGFDIDPSSIGTGGIEVVPEAREVALVAALGLLGFGVYRRARKA